MNSLAFTRCCPSPLTHVSTSPAVPSARIKIRRSRRFRAAHYLAAQKPSRIVAMAAAAPASSVNKEVLPSPLTSASEPPPLFDGTTRLYVAYHCPYAQRAWIARNYKGLYDKIKIVAIDLADRPAWYKEKVYPENKVPSLEHNNQVKGESLDLVKYIDSNFEGPSLIPDDPARKQFAEELLAYTDAFNKALYSSIVSKDDVSEEAVAALDKIEEALGKFNDGPFFLGLFSLVDIAYVPFIERFQIFFFNIKNYDITKGRPNLQKFIEEVNKIDAYTQTKQDPQFLLEHTKKRLGLCMEALPPTMTSACEKPPLYDGTTRLYMSYVCPYAQRAWITRNYKGLQEEIKLVPMDMADKPAWYKNVYPKNEVPSLEHNKRIIGESLDLIKYIDSNFDGPKLITDDPEKLRFAEELLGYSDAFNRAMLDALRSKGPVDIAYVPFIDGFQIFFASIKNYDITKGRVHIQKFIEELNKIDAYRQTKQDPQVLLALTKKKLGV
ncbi:Protein IN2-1-like protein B [Dichanthelium oligosanthes]|uniref:Protein IN2-1-like protein B n=1 Tax=Dichanthelium oligosanthes TaxID=888268 RepID=A0A1E5VLY4_9POAL|nr:Protein IN2-1-like protein B [Dichanthelium oligosanthes]